MNAATPSFLREEFGIRFHHFHDLRGRLVATIVTEPIPDVVDGDSGEGLIRCNAAILFRGSDPIPSLMKDIEAAVRDGDAGDAHDFVEKALLVEVRPADAPSRARGREIALGRLQNEEVDDVVMTESELKEEIANRTILQHFPGGRNLRLRPRAEFPRRIRGGM